MIDAPYSLTEAATAPAPKKKVRKRKVVWLLVVLVGGLIYFTLTANQHRPPMAEVAVADPAMRQQVTDLQNRVQALEAKVAAAAAAPAVAPALVAAPVETTAVAPNADMTKLQSDMASLSSAVTSLQSEVKATGDNADAARQALAEMIASAVAFIALREAAESGHGYADELAVLRDASKDDSTVRESVGRLGPYAAAGAPTLPMLREELVTREPAVAVVIAKGSAQNWWQRLLAELHGLITVRPIHGGEGDDLAAVETALGQGAAPALAAFENLPADAQHSLADWRAQLEARQHIDEEIKTIAAHFTTLPAAKAP